EEWLTDHAVVVSNNFVSEVVPSNKVVNKYSIENFPGCLLIPSFVDVQIYGASGKLFAVYPDTKTLQLIYDYCRAGGAGLFLPTVATNTVEVFHA
ncbi:MAG: N-acetylglucosamine-6-phosphate deacetylase, partial [Chitinophagaceae bacterium]